MTAVDGEDILGLVELGDRDGVIRLLREVIDHEGLEPVIALVSAVQVEVGRRWQTDEWSVADEHAATMLMDFAFSIVTADAAPSPSLGHIVVACAEGEWHVLPARMAASALSAQGWNVTLLGSSLPAEHLATYLHKQRADLVGISCSVPMHLPGARRMINAVHSVGLPVLAGGLAFGGTRRRADALGADGWAAGVDDAHRIAGGWLVDTPTLRDPVADTEHLALAAERPDLVPVAMANLVDRFPPMADYSATQLQRTREDLDYILRFVEAALVSRDDHVIVEFVPWLVQCLEPRGVPRHAITAGLQVLGEVVPPGHAEAGRLLELALTAARG
jgi:methanogenic corrinoid protein MtbC1